VFASQVRGRVVRAYGERLSAGGGLPARVWPAFYREVEALQGRAKAGEGPFRDRMGALDWEGGWWW
jgi:hypothetical protein